MTEQMPAATLAERMAGGQPVFGLTVRMSRSGEIARIARASGHDFLRIDLQHALLDVETVAAIAQAGLAIGIPTVVRVRGVGDPDVAALLDAGIAGIVYPDVETAEQARLCVDACRFPPIGRRSYGGGYPMFDYQSIPVAQAIPELERSTLVVCMLESAAALARADEIAAVPGVDVIHLGMSDYLMSEGVPGAIDGALAEAALARVLEVTRRHGRFAGLGGSPTVEHQSAALRAGVRFLTTKNDIDFVLGAAASWTRRLRDVTETM